MTIRNRILNERLNNLQRCAEKAPEGTFEEARNAAAAIDQAIEAVRSAFKEHGFKADGCDICRDLEASIYGFMLNSNPGHTGLIVAEGFGEHVDGPCGSRMISEAIRDRDFIATIDRERPIFQAMKGGV